MACGPGQAGLEALGGAVHGCGNSKDGTRTTRRRNKKKTTLIDANNNRVSGQQSCLE